MRVEDLIKELQRYADTDPDMKVVLMNYKGYYKAVRDIEEQCLCEAGEDIGTGHVILIDY